MPDAPPHDHLSDTARQRALAQLGRVSDSPTLPGAHGEQSGQGSQGGRGAAARADFDVADLYGSEAPGAQANDGTTVALPPLDEKLRQAYFWITNHAIISPHYDVEFDNDSGGRGKTVWLGDARAALNLPTGQSYSSFLLLPLLTFAVRGRCLLVGGPGRGKTASATLMGVLAGYSISDVRRHMQHGHPQLTVNDLFGTPLPKDLVQAERLSDIDVAWRSWLAMRVKIVDEYNRIPTRTQSALLTVLADGYVESFDQIYEVGSSAWYLTANDDAGGGTYQVIDALRDRIDVVVPALPFNNRFLSALVTRAEQVIQPEDAVPPSIVFSEEEHDRLRAEVLAVPIPRPVLRRLEFFAGQFEYLEGGGRQFEYRTKDTVRLAGIDPHAVQIRDTGRDPATDLGSQTENGLSVRALQSLVLYAKAMAYFRGRSEVGVDDVRAVLPFVLHEKLAADSEAAAFGLDSAEELRTDRISWLRGLFEIACQQFTQLNLDRNDPVGRLLDELDQGLDGLDARTVSNRMREIESALDHIAAQNKLYGHLFDDVLALKYLHQRYLNYLAWLAWQE